MLGQDTISLPPVPRGEVFFTFHSFLDTTYGGIYGIKMILAVIDTNVLIAALRSSTGASHEILLAADRGDFEVALSVPLLAEYEEVCHRPDSMILIPPSAVDDVINRIAQISKQQVIYYLWRGILPDAKDDMVLEVAVAAGASHIITFNLKHLNQASEFGIASVKPSEFLTLL